MLNKIRTDQSQSSAGLVMEHGFRAAGAGMSLRQVYRYLENRSQPNSKRRGPAYQDGVQGLKGIQKPDQILAIQQRSLGLCGDNCTLYYRQ